MCYRSLWNKVISLRCQQERHTMPHVWGASQSHLWTHLSFRVSELTQPRVQYLDVL